MLTAVPLAFGAVFVDATLYDVPGGYRAVMFDRFTGVKPNVSVGVGDWGYGRDRREGRVGRAGWSCHWAFERCLGYLSRERHALRKKHCGKPQHQQNAPARNTQN